MTTLTLHEATQRAQLLLKQHQLWPHWSFSFDRAKRRAGACKYRERVISVSQYFVEASSLQEFDQVMLHEIAHAIAGPGAGHGPVWRATARKIGYTGGRTLNKEFYSREQAPWLGLCPNAHRYYRFRKPSKLSSCPACHRGFSMNYVITWQRNPQHQT